MHFFSVLVIWPKVWPDDVITGITNHEKVNTRNTLNQLKIMKLYENKLFLGNGSKRSVNGLFT